jgi:3-oxoacyl-[acyl-carrier-protein] synthase-3
VNERNQPTRATISAIAHYAPPDVYPNAWYEERLGIADDWIRQRSGIVERRIASSGATSDLIVPAARECLEQRGIGAAQLDCIIFATITPDHVFPATAAIVQRKLGATKAWGFDLSAACCGFIYGLVTAAKLVEAGSCQRVLVCGADKMSAITNFDDRSTAMLFGDAAGVALVEKSEDAELGLRDHLFRMKGEGAGQVLMPAGGSLKPASLDTVAKREHCLVMEGQSIFKNAVAEMAEVSEELLRLNRLTTADLAWLVPHQANYRIIEAVARRLNLDMNKVMANVDRYGNTSAATIPVCLSEWQRKGLLRRGDRLMLTSFGAGFTIGGVYLRWSINGHHTNAD